MKLASYHVHSTFCDGKAELAEMAEAAYGAGFSTLGFSSHAAWPFSTQWHMNADDYDRYTREVRSLAGEWKGRMDIFCGFEADFIPGITAPDKTLYRQFKPDYLVGSVHYIVPSPPSRVDIPPLAIDAPAQEVEEGIRTIFGGDGKRAVRLYWQRIREMAAQCDFDIIAHIDLVRKHNARISFFSETAPWYRRELVKTANVVAASGKIVEISTGAIANGAMDSLYPSQEMLYLLQKKGVPVTVNSDAHYPERISCAYDRAREALVDAGYRSIKRLTHQGWIEESL